MEGGREVRKEEGRKERREEGREGRGEGGRKEAEREEKYTYNSACSTSSDL